MTLKSTRPILGHLRRGRGQDTRERGEAGISPRNTVSGANVGAKEGMRQSLSLGTCLEGGPQAEKNQRIGVSLRLGKPRRWYSSDRKSYVVRARSARRVDPRTAEDRAPGKSDMRSILEVKSGKIDLSSGVLASSCRRSSEKKAERGRGSVGENFGRMRRSGRRRSPPSLVRS